MAHHHDPQDKKRQLNRLSRVIGHLQYVKRMIENDEDCADVLTQISAAKSALNGLGKEIINEHIAHCITHAVEDDGTLHIPYEYNHGLQDLECFYSGGKTAVGEFVFSMDVDDVPEWVELRFDNGQQFSLRSYTVEGGSQ